METIFKLGVVLALHDKITAGLRRVMTQGTDVLDKFKDIRTAVLAVTTAVLALSVAWAVFGENLARDAGRFDYQLQAVAQIGGASDAEKGLLKNAAIQAGIQTQYAPGEALGGLKALTQQGNNARQSIAALVPVLNLAAASMGELTPGQAAGVVSQAMKAYGVEIDDVSLSVDQMVKTTNMFAMSANMLPQGLGNASRGAGLLKLSLDETLISLGLVKQVLPDISRGATNLSMVMERMVKPSVQNALKDIGVDVVVEGQFRPFLDIVNDIATATSGMSDAMRAAFLQKQFAESMGGLGAIINQLTDGITTQSGEFLKGADAIAYYRRQMADAGGTAGDMREAVLGTYEGVSLLLDGSLQTAGQLLGDAFKEIFQPFKELEVAAVNQFIQLWSAIPESLQQFIVLAPLVAGGLSAIVLGLAALAILLPLISTLLTTTPVGWVILAIVGLAAAIAAVIIYWDELVAVLGVVYDNLWWISPPIWAICQAFEVLYDVGSVVFAGLVMLFDDFNEVMDVLGGAIGEWASGVGEAMVEIGRSIVSFMKDWVVGPIAELLGWLDDLTNGWLSKTAGFASDIPGSMADMFAGLGGDGDSARDWLGKRLGSALNNNLDFDEMDINGSYRPAFAGAVAGGAGGAGSGGSGGSGSGATINFYGDLKVEARDILEARKVEDVLADTLLQAAEVA